MREEVFPRSPCSMWHYLWKDTAMSRMTNYEKHHPDPARRLLYASPSMVAAFQWPMSLHSTVGAEKTAQREVSHLCNVRQPLPAPSHRDTLVPGALTTAKPLSQVVSASLGVLHVSCCLAAILVIPAMGKRSPAERQLLAPEIVPKKSPH